MKEVTKKSIAANESLRSQYGDSLSKDRGFLWSFVAGILFLMRAITTLIILAVIADLLLSNCDPSAMTSVKLANEIDFKNFNYEKTRRQITNRLYPASRKVFEYAHPYGIAIGEFVWSIYEPVSIAVKPYWKEASKYGNMAYKQTWHYIGVGNKWLLANGVDVSKFGNWITNTAV